MRCELWKSQALPYTEGTLDVVERQDYAAHLDGCAECRSEVAASQLLRRELRDLSPIEFGADEAALFDAAVMSRVNAVPAAAPLAVALTADAELPTRQHAANSISVAARSKLTQRRFEPLFAPIRSLIALTLAATTCLVALAVLYGDALIQAFSGTFSSTIGSLWVRSSWLVEAALGRIVELMTAVEVSRGLLLHLRPWLEAWNLLLTTRGPEVAVVSVVTTLLILLTVWRIRRVRRRERVAVRSS